MKKGLRIYSVFLVLLCMSISAFAKEKKLKTPKLKASEIQKLSFNRIQLLRQSYIDFLKKAEGEFYKVKHDNSKIIVPHKSSFIKYYKFIQNTYSAYASNDQVCFFGGWPSQMSGSYCEAPWKHQDNDFGDSYTPDMACGNNNRRSSHPLRFR